MNIIERFTNPSKHVQEPWGTIHKNGDQYFIQVSKDSENPNWITFGDLMKTVYLDSIRDDDFVLNALRVYAEKTSNLGANLFEFEDGA